MKTLINLIPSRSPSPFSGVYLFGQFVSVNSPKSSPLSKNSYMVRPLKEINFQTCLNSLGKLLVINGYIFLCFIFYCLILHWCVFHHFKFRRCLDNRRKTIRDKPNQEVITWTTVLTDSASMSFPLL